MNITEIRHLVHKRTQMNPDVLKKEDLVDIESLLENSIVQDYLEKCLGVSTYTASGVSVLSLSDIREYAVKGCSPGGYILPFGYLVIAMSIGGNAVCFGNDGRVYWADHDTFTSSITYHDRKTGIWEDWGNYTEEKVKEALLCISDSIEDFLLAFLTDKLTEQLEALD
jgi:hypothetical protein